jgi:hypothetical protein
MKTFALLISVLITFTGFAQTMKIAHKSHSGQKATFKVLRHLDNMGLPTDYKKKKEDTTPKIVEKKTDVKKKSEKLNTITPQTDRIKPVEKTETITVPIESQKSKKTRPKSAKKGKNKTARIDLIAHPSLNQSAIANENTSYGRFSILLSVLLILGLGGWWILRSPKTSYQHS